MALASVSYIFKAFIKRAVIFIKGAVIFIGKGGSAIGRLFKTARVKINNIKGVNKCNLK